MKYWNELERSGLVELASGIEGILDYKTKGILTQVTDGECLRCSDIELRTISTNVNISLNAMKRLAVNSDFHTRALLAANSAIPIPIQQLLVVDGSVSVRESLALNPSLDSSIIRNLASDEKERVRVAIAKHPSLPKDLFQSFVIDADSVVAELMSRLDVDESIISAFLGLQDWKKGPLSEKVKRAFINPNCPKHIIDEVLMSNRRGLKTRLIENPSLSIEDAVQLVIEALSDSAHPKMLLSSGLIDNPRVNNEALIHALLLESKLADNDLLKQLIARSKYASSEDLMSLALLNNPIVNLELAKNRQSPPDVLRVVVENEYDDLLSKSKSELRELIVQHPNIPEDCQLRLVNLFHMQGFNHAIETMSCNKELTTATLDAIFKIAREEYILYRLSLNPNASTELLESIATLRIGHIRVAVAMHENTSDAILLRYSKLKTENIAMIARNRIIHRRIRKMRD